MARRWAAALVSEADALLGDAFGVGEWPEPDLGQLADELGAAGL